MKLAKRKLWIIYIVSIFVSKILYDYAILNFLPSIYFDGISYGVDFNFNQAIVGYIIYFAVGILTFILYQFSNNIFSLLINALFFIYFLPLNSSYYLNNASFLYFILTHLFWISLLIFGKLLTRKSKGARGNLSCKVKTNAGRLVGILLLIFSIGILYFAYRYNGLHLYFGIGDIYETRAEYVNSTKIIDSFFFNFGGFVIPIGILYFLKRRSYIFSIYLVFIQLVLYSIAREKIKLMVIALVFIIYIFSRLKLINTIKTVLPFFFMLLILFPIFENYILGTNYIFSIFIRRLMYYPAWLSKLYYEFFSTHELLYWTQDIFLLHRLNLNVYNESCLTLINNAYFHGLVPAPNAGLFAEAYMHFGIVGSIIYPLVIVLYIKGICNSFKIYSDDIQLLVAILVCLALISIPVTSGTFFITYIMFIPINWLIMQLSDKIKFKNLLGKKKVYSCLFI